MYKTNYWTYRYAQCVVIYHIYNIEIILPHRVSLCKQSFRSGYFQVVDFNKTSDFNKSQCGQGTYKEHRLS